MVGRAIEHRVECHHGWRVHPRHKIEDLVAVGSSVDSELVLYRYDFEPVEVLDGRLQGEAVTPSVSVDDVAHWLGPGGVGETNHAQARL
jgi:hypothetical protein